jgi:NAD(P)-dependent dehydrogenase (short-subunit alcohol dehydrogenase family)
MSIPSLSQTGKVVVVTGARRGLGKAMALGFAEAGADVAICDYVIDGGELADVAKQIEQYGRKSLFSKVDVTIKTDIEAFIQQVIGKFGRINILINNAGLLGSGPFLEHTEELWDAIIDTNVKGTFLCSQAVSKIMIQQKEGTIINMASVAGFRAGSTYSVSKAGVVMLTKTLARSLAPYNIRVNAIAPNVTRTEKEPSRTMSEAFWTNPEAIANAATRTPMGRIGEPSDIVGPALFLASDAAKFVTGHILAVDGGFLT